METFQFTWTIIPLTKNLFFFHSCKSVIKVLLQVLFSLVSIQYLFKKTQHLRIEVGFKGCIKMFSCSSRSKLLFSTFISNEFSPIRCSKSFNGNMLSIFQNLKLIQPSMKEMKMYFVWAFLQIKNPRFEPTTFASQLIFYFSHPLSFYYDENFIKAINRKVCDNVKYFI